MQSDSIEPDSLTPTPATIPTRLVARLFEAVGQAVDSAELARRCVERRIDPGDSVSDRLDILGAIGHDLGLRTRTSTATVVEALQVVRAGQPLAATDELGRRWYLLVPGRGARVDAVLFESVDDPAAPPQQTAEEAVVKVPETTLANASEDQILELLGASSDSAIHWLVAGAATPNAAAASGHDSEVLTNTQRLVRLMAPERGDVLVVLVFAIAIGIFTLALPIAVQAMVTSVMIGGTFQPLISVTIFLAFALTFAAGFVVIQTWVVELLQRRLFVRAVADLAARLPRVETSRYDSGFGPERVNRFFDVITIQKAVAKMLTDVLGITLAIIVGLTALAFYHPFLLAFDVVLLAVIAVVVFSPLRRGEKTAVKESTAKYEVASWLQEIARNPLAFRTAGADAWIFERSDALSREWVGRRRLHFRTLFTHITSALALQVIASTTLLAIGGWLVIQNSLTLGQLVAAELIVSAVVVGVAKLGKSMETWYDLMAAVAKVGYLLDQPIESSHGEHHAHSGHDRDGRRVGARLELMDIQFDAPAGLSSLAQADFSIEPGERVLVGGLDGGGRLAMVDLVWRLRQPTSGVIRLDGRDLRDLAPEFLRREIAVVSKIEWVKGSVRENVSLGRPFVLNDDIRDALEATGLREVFAGFDGGLDAVIHPDSRGLSDDDLRRLMLARALAGDPGVLVIDAAGQGRDSKYHAAIQNLLDLDDGRTIVVLTSGSCSFSGHDRIVDLAPAVLAGSDA
ncbi:MAG: putative ABC transport system ATP-binding protein [Planctomycetota bacterium]|jgi:putative ABC transport system ATP-binding protein